MNREKKRTAVQAVIRRGDVYYADLDPATGHEQGGTRPVVVLSNDIGNIRGGTVIIAPATSQEKSHLPTHIYTKAEHGIFEKDSVILLEQLRTLDHSRLFNYIGRLDNMVMQRINNALPITFGLNKFQEKTEETENQNE
jgi:mRNA interferase MazF